MTSGYFFKNLAGFLVTAFTSISQGDNLAEAIPAFFKEAGQVIFTTSMPFMVLISIVGVLINFLIIGPMVSFQSMKPDIKKLNPVSNLKNMFKIKTFIELIKSILKISGAIILIWSVVSNSLEQIISTAAMPMVGAAVVFSEFLIKVAIRVGIFFLAIAIFDLVFQKKNFAKEMKMEKFEVKQEMKDTDGNPEIKGKRRQVQQELAYQENPQAAGRARAIVTNPIHVAVALSYDEETDPAPKIIVMGKGVTAESIIKIGLDNNVPIMRNVTLAQELYNKGRMGHYVPEETYEAIAEVLKWLAQLEASEQTLDLFT